MAKQDISSRNAPILWSTVDQAFNSINDNFNELYATIAGGGGEIVDFTNLGTSVIARTTEEYDLGSADKKWRKLFVSGSNGIQIGDVGIVYNGVGLSLPPGSDIGGASLDNTYFKTISVSGQDNIVADDSGESVLTLGTTTGVVISTNSLTNTITFSNSGVTSVVNGAGIGINNSTGIVTITNNGIVTASAGSGITIATPSPGNITIANNGIISVVTDPGSGISLDTSVPNVVRITNSQPNIAQEVIRNVTVPGQEIIISNSQNYTLTVAEGSGIGLTTNPTLGRLTITNTGVTAISATGPGLTANLSTGNVVLNFDNNIDIIGSLFSDDSTLLVDGVSGQIVGPISSFDGVNSITMDPDNGVIIGGTAGAQIIGAASAPVYIGGGTSGGTSGDIFLGHGTNRVLFVSNVIDTDDSSALIFEPPVTFNTDVTFENDITVVQQLTVNGSRVINLSELKSIVADSTDFSDFQARIAAL